MPPPISYNVATALIKIHSHLLLVHLKYTKQCLRSKLHAKDQGKPWCLPKKVILNGVHGVRKATIKVPTIQIALSLKEVTWFTCV